MLIPLLSLIFALIATAISTATTKIANNKIVTTKRIQPTIDTVGGVNIPAAKNLIATNSPTNCNSTDALAIIATANHLPHIRSDLATGVVNNASNVPRSRSPAVRSMEGCTADVAVHNEMIKGTNSANVNAACSPDVAISAASTVPSQVTGS